jgi:hypothetical protein
VAATHPAPAADDLISLEEGVALLRETPYPRSASTIKRWIKRYGIDVVRIGRVDHISFTDLLEAHRDEIYRRDGLSA